MFADNNAVSIDEAFGEYGDDAYAVLETFYATVARLFEKGSLGCVRLVARCP